MKRCALGLLALLVVPFGHAQADRAVASRGVDTRGSAREQNMEGLLFPRTFAAQDARDLETAQALEGTLRGLPNVASAQVIIQRAHPALVPLDQPLPAPEVTVTLEMTNEGPPPDELENALASARVSLPGAAVKLMKTYGFPAADQPRDAAPAETKGSTERTALALSLAANVLLATVLLLTARRRWR